MSRLKNGYPLPKTRLAIACPAQTPYNPRRFSAPAAMKAILPILCALLAACAPPSSPATGPVEPADAPAATADAPFGRNLIIFYDTPQAEKTLLAAAGQYGARLLYRYHHLRAIAVAIPANRDMAQAVAHFSRLPGVNRVARDRIHQLDSQQGTP